MPKRQMNKLRWKAELCTLGEVIDPETDRVTMGYPKIRDIRYNNMGVTATDKFTTKDTNEVVKKIETRIDRAVEEKQKNYRIRIKDTVYNIERLYVKEAERMMELSLSYEN